MSDTKDHQRELVSRQSRVRGMMLGLALGDTVGAARGALPASGPLRAGVSTQLACFTVEGIIRAQVRGNHKGICYAPGVVLHAYSRWAFLQGIETEKMRDRWASHTASWPDGWLARVPALGERRGSAPATVAALSRIDAGEEQMATTSRGHHALTRGLPIAVTGLGGITQADAVAALTHGDPAGRSATVHAAVLAHYCLTDSDSEPGRSVRDALQAGITALAPRDERGGLVATDEEHGRLGATFQLAVDEPADPSRLAQLAPDPTAPSALLGGLYVAASFPDRTAFPAALDFAAKAPDGESVACVAGALLGAVHGVEALPVALVSRHELAWVLDTLARDLVLELDDSPSGSEYIQGWDAHWWERYPGW
ncbi:ADP-ribosylglycohydrolase family protein [Streptomyces spinosisporus]|uniref:ADP-ribosylglycohydrolase family protein n=1 Tax=Streptomyces spinosisporus TaxID=2927582 RepID=A0ABS9X9J3_9ACTN|nr:ADP-ribosylglycohydrolase family protein [Streptomyces spinosisporus]MCI3238743.1 ADP-ribosylglycohydrolase family protein [Streptomyces spinosisporus]